jgi:hypothetical protein
MLGTEMKPRASAVIMAVLFLLALAKPSIASAIAYTWTGKGKPQKGWDDVKNWRPEGVPKKDDDVTIGVPQSAGQVKLNQDARSRASRWALAATSTDVSMSSATTSAMR